MITQQQQRLVYLPLLGAIILFLLVGVYLTVRKRSSKSAPSNKVTRHRVQTPPDETLNYWTADKMRTAKAVPLPEVNTLEREKQNPSPSPKQDT
jgi:hypothetical protein